MARKTLVKFPQQVVEILDVASAQTAGLVYKAIMKYVATGEEPADLPPDAMCIFLCAKQFIRLPKAVEEQVRETKQNEAPVQQALPVIDTQFCEPDPETVPRTVDPNRQTTPPLPPYDTGNVRICSNISTA